MRFILIVLLFYSRIATGQPTFRYDLDRPVIQHTLPSILNEISGLTDIDSISVAAVQDELGTVFIYDFIRGEIMAQYDFEKAGDFEGLTYAKNTLYILRSDGRLTEWNDFPKNKSTIKHSTLPVTTSNNEGLCFDPKNNVLLIAAKSKPFNPAEKSERFIYSYDIVKKKLNENPVYSLNTEQLAGEAVKFNIQEMVSGPRNKKRPFNFRPSSLSVHPVTDDIYIISAVDRLLIVINRKGEVTQMKSLNPQLFAKAEGITFLNNGTMIITNEAAGGAPTLFVFDMKK